MVSVFPRALLTSSPRWTVSRRILVPCLRPHAAHSSLALSSLLSLPSAGGGGRDLTSAHARQRCFSVSFLQRGANRGGGRGGGGHNNLKNIAAMMDSSDLSSARRSSQSSSGSPLRISPSSSMLISSSSAVTDKKKPFLIGVAGGTASGKVNFCIYSNYSLKTFVLTYLTPFSPLCVSESWRR